MIVDFAKLDLKTRYKIMSRSVIPRPIAWIVTEGKTLNIAPFSYFMALSSEPPTLIASIGHKKDGSPKDTLKNILDQKRCTICSVSPQQLTKMHKSSEMLPEEQSEAEIFDIETREILEGFPPMVKDSGCAFFCSLHQVVDLQGSKTIPLILKIEHYWVDERFSDNDFNIELQTVARVGKGYRVCDKIVEP